MGVSVLQYLEGIPDRQAVDFLRYHVGWNFALNRHIGDALFHPSTLVNFRQRLIEHGLSAIGFQQILEALMEAGLVARHSHQRLDSTQIFGKVSRMSRLDCVRESVRLTLEELERVVPPPNRPAFWSTLWERYVESQVDYRASSQTLAAKLVESGTDAARLLDWLQAPGASHWLQGLQVQLLVRVFGEQFEMVTGATQPKGKEQLTSDRVQNPHDPEATYSCKGEGKQKKEHVGYKVQVAESVSQAELAAGEPTRNFLMGVTTHAAYHSDEGGAAKLEAEQASMNLEKPPVQYVDGAYISGQKLAEAKAEGRELIGPAAAARPNDGGRFTTERFEVHVEQRQATCPAGKLSTQCSRLAEAQTGHVTFRFEWSYHCAGCSLRSQCVESKQKHRTIVVTEYHSALQARRLEQRAEAFKERMKHRNGIEGTQSELVRAHGLRRARYRGLDKARLQNYFMGAACNVKRWIRREIWKLNAIVSALEATPTTA